MWINLGSSSICGWSRCLALFSISSLTFICSLSFQSCISFNFIYKSIFCSFLWNSRFSTRMMFSFIICPSSSRVISLRPTCLHSDWNPSLFFCNCAIFQLLLSNQVLSSLIQLLVSSISSATIFAYRLSLPFVANRSYSSFFLVMKLSVADSIFYSISCTLFLILTSSTKCIVRSSLVLSKSS